MEKKVFLNWLILVLIILEIVLSASLVYQSWQGSNLCIVGNPASCNDVQSSSYNDIFGIKITYLAFFAFIALLVLYFSKENWFLFCAGIGTLGALYFLFIQFFVLKTVCSTCLLVDGVMMIIFILSLVNRRITK
ncbi:MAG: vitamin K epoxide reductase family protein [Nanoarchaeota archaeon]